MKNDKPEHHPSELKEQAKHWNLGEWEQKCQSIDNEQLTDLIPFASLHYDPTHWKDKLHSLMQHLSRHNRLESAGKSLSLEQLHEILYHASVAGEAPHADKLAALFNGISQTLFYGLIVRISPEQMAVLRQTAESEVVQHHLSILSHQIREKFDNLCIKLEAEEKYLEHLDLKEIEEIYQTLENLHKDATEIAYVTDRALALAWNTNRIDIIQELSRTKELCQRCLTTNIGSPASEGHAATGLWELLEKHKGPQF